MPLLKSPRRPPASYPCFWLLCLVALLAGCASTPVKKAPGAVIENKTGRSIRTILYRSCGIESAAWQPIIAKSLLSQQQVSMELPMVDCLDLRAEFADGRVAGMQENVQRRFPLYWVLR